MPARRWLDRTQPQTLFIAVILLYLNGAFSLLSALGAGSQALLGLLFAAGEVGAGFGIANDKKWGYGLGIVMAIVPFALRLTLVHNPFATDLITLMFEIALVCLLLHPQSREYQRIWFK